MLEYVEKKGGFVLKKLSIVKIILRVLFSLIFLGLAIWFILPMRVAIFDIGNLLGLFFIYMWSCSFCFWNKFKSICKKISSRKLGKCILVIITSLVTMEFHMLWLLVDL